MQPYNPYAPPTDASPNAPGAFGGYGVWQEDGRVAMYTMGAMLPNRCAACNGPGKHTVHKTFYWHNPWLYLTIFAGVLIYAIIATFVRKTANVQYWLCDEHRQKRTLGLALAWGGFVGAMVLLFVGAGMASGPVVIASLVAMIALPIVGSIMAQIVRAVRIDDATVVLKAGEPFVASLPAQPDPGAMGYGMSGFGSPGYGAPGYGGPGHGGPGYGTPGYGGPGFGPAPGIASRPYEPPKW